MLLLATLPACTLTVRTLPNAYLRLGERSTYTDGEGMATLPAYDGDTLHVHHAGYRDTSLVVSCENPDITVRLTVAEYMLPEVVVERSIGEAVSSRPIRAVDREVLLYPSSPTLRPDDALEEIPGVVFVGKDPLASVPAVRGLAFFRTLVLLDFMRLSTEREIGPSLFFAPAGILRAVEVAEGGNIPFGSDAVGGVVTYLLKGVGDPEEFSLFLRSNPPTASLYAAHYPSDSLYVGIATASTGDYTYPDTLTSDGLWGRGSLRAPSSNRKFASILEFRRWGMGVKAALFSTRDFHRAYVGRMYYPEISHAFLFFGSRYLSAGYHGYTVLSRKGDVENLRRGRDLTLRLQFSRSSLQFGASYFGRLGVVSEVLEGGRPNYREIDDASVHDLALFLFGSHRLRNLLLSAGGRLGAYRASNVRGWKVVPSGHLGVKVEVGRLLLSANLETSYRYPTLTETNSRSYRPRGLILGNPDLKPERGVGGDLGLRWEGKGLSFEVLGFGTAVRDYIDLTGEDTVLRYANLRGTATVLGLEVSGRAHLKGQVLTLTYTHINGKAGDRVVSGVPPSVLRLGWEAGERLKPYVKAEYRPEVRDVALIDVPRPHSLVLTVGVRGEAFGLEVDGGVSNLNGAVYYRTLNPKSLPMPGRGAYLNLRYAF